MQRQKGKNERTTFQEQGLWSPLHLNVEHDSNSLLPLSSGASIPPIDAPRSFLFEESGFLAQGVGQRSPQRFDRVDDVRPGVADAAPVERIAP